jgi:hypothetical protein
LFISHHTFYFHFSNVFWSQFDQPSAFNIFTCKCGHKLDESSTHLICCLFGCQQITTHDAIWDAMPSFKKMGTLYGENDGMPSHQELHSDSKRLGLRCQCGGYWPNGGDGGFECHYSTNKCSYRTKHHC